MINTIKHAAQEGASKCIKAILVVGTTLFITLNIGANPASAEVKKEIKDILKKNPEKEIVVKVEESKKIENTAKYEQTQNTIDPDTTTIKNFFLNGGFLTPSEVTDFNSMRTESLKSPSRPAVKLTMFDIRETTSGDFEKAIFITSFLDPFQKTTLGKSAFTEINNNATLKGSYSLCCKMYIQNIKTIKAEKEYEVAQKEKEVAQKEYEKLKRTLELLQQLEEIYIKYLNK